MCVGVCGCGGCGGCGCALRYFGDADHHRVHVHPVGRLNVHIAPSDPKNTSMP